MILIVAAMLSEAEALIKGFKKEVLFDNKEYYRGYINNKKVIVLITGIGKTNASLHLASVLVKEEIDFIINVGFVGAKGDFEIGEVVLVNKAAYGDVDVSAFTKYEKGQIPKMPKYFLSDEQLFNEYKKVINKESLLYTQDQFVLASDENDCLFDMEGASFYQTAYVFNKPIIAIKIVSDILEKDNQIENYIEFENKSSGVIKDIINKVI